jgi:hypothetical protein
MPALSPGGQIALTQNVAYALPARRVHITSTVALEVSVDKVAWSALTGANTTGAFASGTYVRCPTANCVIVCKAD